MVIDTAIICLPDTTTIRVAIIDTVSYEVLANESMVYNIEIVPQYEPCDNKATADYSFYDSLGYTYYVTTWLETDNNRFPKG